MKIFYTVYTRCVSCQSPRVHPKQSKPYFLGDDIQVNRSAVILSGVLSRRLIELRLPLEFNEPLATPCPCPNNESRRSNVTCTIHNSRDSGRESRSFRETGETLFPALVFSEGSSLRRQRYSPASFRIFPVGGARIVLRAENRVGASAPPHDGLSPRVFVMQTFAVASCRDR